MCYRKIKQRDCDRDGRVPPFKTTLSCHQIVLPSVEKVINEAFWESPKATDIDYIRKQLRGLMYLIEKEQETSLY